jgi:ubiquinone biosynthesis protein Coq4
MRHEKCESAAIHVDPALNNHSNMFSVSYLHGAEPLEWFWVILASKCPMFRRRMIGFKVGGIAYDPDHISCDEYCFDFAEVIQTLRRLEPPTRILSNSEICETDRMTLKCLLDRHRKHHSHPSYLTFLKGSIGMMLNPEGTQSVFDIEDGLVKSESTCELLRFTARDESVRKLIDERYLQPVPETERLGQLPKNTLGYKYFYHLDSMGFDPNYYRKIDVESDVEYVMMRIRQTHDIWHVMTGFDTHPLGEIALKGVELAQTHRPMAAAICAGGVFRYMLRQPEEFGACLESIVGGYHMGLSAKPLLAMKWEELWERDVEEIRAELGLEVLGPRGGQLNREFAPKSSLADSEAREALSEVLRTHDVHFPPQSPGDSSGNQ